MPGNAAINLTTAPDNAPTPASTIDGGTYADHINLDVFNQAIFWQVKQTINPRQPAGMADWQIPVAMAPGSRTIDRDRIVGIRFWAFTPAAQLPPGSIQAAVTAEVVYA